MSMTAILLAVQFRDSSWGRHRSTCLPAGVWAAWRQLSDRGRQQARVPSLSQHCIKGTPGGVQALTSSQRCSMAPVQCRWCPHS